MTIAAVDKLHRKVEITADVATPGAESAPINSQQMFLLSPNANSLNFLRQLICTEIPYRLVRCAFVPRERASSYRILWSAWAED